MKLKLLSLIAIPAFAFGLIGCSEPTESEEATEEAGDAIEETADEIEESTDN